MRRLRRERGGAAVEFALIVPVLLLLIIGAMEFSRLWNQQISLSNAARSSARVMAISNNSGQAVTAGINAAPSLNPALGAGNFSFSPGACTPGAVMSVTVSYSSSLLTDFLSLPATFNLTGKAATPCGG